jgi:putative heme iron utilization protein
MTAHSKGRVADPRCSLLFGEPGRGDPLAHARMTVHCDATLVEPESEDKGRSAARYLAHSPKAKLYAGVGDWRFWRLEIQSTSLNGGFGRAYNLTPAELLTQSPANPEIAGMEISAVEHMNEDHLEAVGLYATHFAGAPPGNWKLLGLDAEGLDIGNGDDLRRVFFPEPLTSAGDVRMALVKMAGDARAALKQSG